MPAAQNDGLQFDILKGKNTLGRELDRMTAKARQLGKAVRDAQGGITGRPKGKGALVLTPKQLAARDISDANATKRSIAAQRGVVREQGRLVDDRIRVERRARLLSGTGGGVGTRHLAVDSLAAVGGRGTPLVRRRQAPLQATPRGPVAGGYGRGGGGFGGIPNFGGGGGALGLLDLAQTGAIAYPHLRDAWNNRTRSVAPPRRVAHRDKRTFGLALDTLRHNWRESDPYSFMARNVGVAAGAAARTAGHYINAPLEAGIMGPARFIGRHPYMVGGALAAGAGLAGFGYYKTQQAVAEHEQYRVRLRTFLGGKAEPTYQSLLAASIPTRYGPGSFVDAGAKFSMLGDPKKIRQMTELAAAISEGTGQTDMSAATRAIQGMLIKGKLDQEVIEPLRTLGVDLPMIYKRFMLQDKNTTDKQREWIRENTNADFRRSFFEASGRGLIQEEQVIRLLNYMRTNEFRIGSAAGTWGQVTSTAGGQWNIAKRQFGELAGNAAPKSAIISFGNAVEVFGKAAEKWNERLIKEEAREANPSLGLGTLLPWAEGHQMLRDNSDKPLSWRLASFLIRAASEDRIAAANKQALNLPEVPTTVAPPRQMVAEPPSAVNQFASDFDGAGGADSKLEVQITNSDGTTETILMRRGGKARIEAH